MEKKIDLNREPSLPLPPGLAVSGDPASSLTSRVHAEPPHPYRTPFARDAARILHTRAFRRLAGKTQVFTRLPGDPPGDHFRSRLTHTLEVTQISRTLANALGLNAELAESLALVHDIGHPPFGHAGEKALDTALRAHGLSFDHSNTYLYCRRLGSVPYCSRTATPPLASRQVGALRDLPAQLLLLRAARQPGRRGPRCDDRT